MAEPLLSVEHVSRRFGGLLAVNAASLSAPAARITALIGPNGAGKTTLFAVISGFLRPSAGRVRYAGEDVTGEPPHQLARRGIARTFQIVQPFAGLSVRDNILVGAHLRHGARAAALAVAEEVGREIGLGDMLDRPAHTLTVAGRKRLELARALATEPKLLLLDEVLAGLNPSEIRDIVPVIRALSRARHRRRHDRACHAGGDEPCRARLRAGRRPHHRRRHPGAGRGRSRRRRGLSRPRRGGQDRRRRMPTEPLLDVRELCAGYGDTEVLRGIDLEGRSRRDRRRARLERRRQVDAQPHHLRHRARRARGAIRFDGAAIEREKPAAIVERGLIHVPEGRRIFPNLSVRENLDLGSYRRAAARRAANRDRVFAIFPRLYERRAQRGRHAIGRRAADARDRPRPDGRAEVADSRRAVARALAASGRGVVRADRAHPRATASPFSWSSRTWCRASTIASRAYILAEGQCVMSGPAADIGADPQLKRAYLGL